MKWQFGGRVFRREPADRPQKGEIQFAKIPAAIIFSVTTLSDSTMPRKRLSDVQRVARKAEVSEKARPQSASGTDGAQNGVTQ